MLTEETIKLLVKTITTLNFTYPRRGGGNWVPAIEVWRSGEGKERSLPYIGINSIPTPRTGGKSISDVIGYKGPPDYHVFGYYELELVNICVYTNNEHSGGKVHGRLFGRWAINKIRQTVLKSWESILGDANACFDRRNTFAIKPTRTYDPSVGINMFEFSVDVLIRTDVTWDYTPSDYDEDDAGYAESGVMTLKDEYDIRVELN